MSSGACIRHAHRRANLCEHRYNDAAAGFNSSAPNCSSSSLSPGSPLRFAAPCTFTSSQPLTLFRPFIAPVEPRPWDRLCLPEDIRRELFAAAPDIPRIGSAPAEPRPWDRLILPADIRRELFAAAPVVPRVCRCASSPPTSRPPHSLRRPRHLLSSGLGIR